MKNRLFFPAIHVELIPIRKKNMKNILGYTWFKITDIWTWKKSS